MFSVLLFTLLVVATFSAPITVHDTDTTATPVDLTLTSCLQDKYNAAKGGTATLSCTASDVNIITMKPLNPYVGGYCYNNEAFYFDAIVTFAITASTRYDPGVFFAYSGSGALTGTCSATYMDTAWTEERAVGISNIESGASSDACADATSAQNVVVLMRVQTKCQNTNSNTSFADIQYCTTWHHNTGADCFDIDDLYPSTSSKCHCGSYNDLFRICERCTITRNYEDVTRPCGADANEFAAEVGDFSFSAGCQSSTISYTDTATGPCSATRVASAEDSCGNVIYSAPQLVVNDCSGSCKLPETNRGVTYDCAGDWTASTSDVDSTGCFDLDSSDETFTEPCGTFTRTWTAEDVCGDPYSYEQTITITDTNPPVVTCPTGAAANVNCGVPTGVDADSGIDTIETSGNSTYNKVEVVYRAEDQCENHVHVTCTYLCNEYSFVAE